MIDAQIDRAVKILRAGGLVAFATETVYGLGADATNVAAIEKIFLAKGRPSTNPLIVHVHDEYVARRFARDWPNTAQILAKTFWPGPLTIVVPKSSEIVSQVTAGKSSVGLRVPDHSLALQLLHKFGGAIAAPSANRSNHISPTTAAHVKEELGDRVDLILDGGACVVGIESTVIDLTRAVPTILRPGAISRLQIESAIGPVQEFTGHVDANTAAAAPGQQSVHYAPLTPAFRFTPPLATNNTPEQSDLSKPRALLLMLPFRESKADDHVYQMPIDPSRYAQIFYDALRKADASMQGIGPDSTIWIELPPDSPDWHAVRDRIIRATQPASVR